MIWMTEERGRSPWEDSHRIPPAKTPTLSQLSCGWTWEQSTTHGRKTIGRMMDECDVGLKVTLTRPQLPNSQDLADNYNELQAATTTILMKIHQQYNPSNIYNNKSNIHFNFLCRPSRVESSSGRAAFHTAVMPASISTTSPITATITIYPPRPSTALTLSPPHDPHESLFTTTVFTITTSAGNLSQAFLKAKGTRVQVLA